ncbi:hypothetical protein EC973_007363 [Apophysomyces ossiformis]|uniref:MATH domain-containing protein n=1 Tax=Apophysomyces ossiformis TaxID=679940 RepID=A0A8H7EU89_9FUNG|nr:hypothetical protein EC973_007363 [Apophysomyces ossiformis]
MSGINEHKPELQFYYHVSRFLQQRLHDVKELQATNGRNWHNDIDKVDDLLKQTRTHIQFIQDESTMSKQDKDAISLDFVKLELALSQYESECKLRMVNLKLEDIAQKYNAKSQQCEELESRLQLLENKVVQGQPSVEKIDLQGSLAVVAKLAGFDKETRCFIFNHYTAYQDLCKMVQEAFYLSSFIVQTKHDHDGNELKTISTAAEYKEAIQNLIKDGKPDGHAHLMEIYVQDNEEKEDTKTDSDIETESDRHSEQFVKLDEQDIGSVIPKTKATFNDKKEAETHPYLDSIALKHFPPDSHKRSYYGSYHWRVREWKDIECIVRSEIFDVGGHEWRLIICGPVYPNTVKFYIQHACVSTHNVGAKFMLLISNVTTPEKHLGGGGPVREFVEDGTYSPLCTFAHEWTTKECKEKGIFNEDNQFNVSVYIRIGEALPEVDELLEDVTSEKANQ